MARDQMTERKLHESLGSLVSRRIKVQCRVNDLEGQVRETAKTIGASLHVTPRGGTGDTRRQQTIERNYRRG